MTTVEENVVRLSGIVGRWLDDDEAPIQRFAADAFDSVNARSSVSVWVYLTNRRLLFTDGRTGIPLLSYALPLVVGARLHKQEVDLFVEVDQQTVEVRRLWVRPKAYASAFVDGVVAMRSAFTVPPMAASAILHASTKGGRGWAPPRPDQAVDYK